MTKKLKKSITVLLMITMLMSICVPAFAMNAQDTNNQNLFLEARITNLETGEVVNLEPVEISSVEKASILNTRAGNGSETSNTIGVKVNAVFPQSRLTDLDGVTGGGVDAYLYVDYSAKTESGTKYVRVDRVRGSWTPSSPYIIMSGRAVDYGDGEVIGGNSAHQTPTSNSFSYTTGWDYTLYYPATNYSGARAYSCATASMSGGSNYLLECFVRIADL